MKALILAVAGLVLIGCGSNGTPPEGSVIAPASKARSRISAPAKVAPPNFNDRTSLKMVRKGDEVRVGDDIDSALRAFSEERNAYKVTEMPPGWKDPAYSCQGWDTGLVGFAAITFDEKVALALYHEDKVSEDRLQEILDTYQRMLQSNGQPETGSKVRYRFWEDGNQRLMICAVQSPEGLNISIALGVKHIMDFFNMNPLSASKDRQEAERLFQAAAKIRQNQ